MHLGKMGWEFQAPPPPKSVLTFCVVWVFLLVGLRGICVRLLHPRLGDPLFSPRRGQRAGSMCVRTSPQISGYLFGQVNSHSPPCRSLPCRWNVETKCTPAWSIPGLRVILSHVPFLNTKSWALASFGMFHRTLGEERCVGGVVSGPWAKWVNSNKLFLLLTLELRYQGSHLTGSPSPKCPPLVLCSSQAMICMERKYLLN